jgi:hypothetical protein
MTKGTAIIFSIFMGFAIGLVGMYLTGYLAAVAISKEYFQWFEENLFVELGHMLISIIQQFFAVGILGLTAGYLIGRFSPYTWKVNTMLCYLAFVFYLTVGVPVLFGTAMKNPIEGQAYWTLVPMLILPICISVAGYYSASRYNKSLQPMQ